MIPHFAVPFRFEQGRAAQVDQDSREEIYACVDTILRTPTETRPEAPDFGLVDQTFNPSIQEVQDAVTRWEPRAEIDTPAEVEHLNDLVGNIQVSPSVNRAALNTSDTQFIDTGDEDPEDTNG